MKHLKLGGACVVIAAMVVMAVGAPAQAKLESPNASDLPIASAALTPGGLDPLANAELLAVTRLGIPIPRAREAIAVQNAVERENLISKLDAALGDAYGGVWYVLEAAQLHVGVTSPAAAQIAEGLAVQAGLGLRVIAIPVRSSEAELKQAQRRLDRRLADLLAGEEAMTWRAAEDNSVHIELGSEVPADERAAIEEEASNAPVEVIVTSASSPNLGVTPQAQCRKFEAQKAYCDPTVTAGITLEDDISPWCTAGPLVLPPKGSTDTYVLSAGHCYKSTKEKWSSSEKTGAVKEVIGEVVAIVSEANGDNADVAAIKVENPVWRKAGDIPVVPAIAVWDKAKETNPIKVEGQLAPAAKDPTCNSGQISGYQCGTIKATGLSAGKLKEMVEVEGIKTQFGDSGGPWFSKETGLVQGIHTGENKGNGNPVFEDLKWALKRLNEVAKLDVELLTTKNEKRM
ncbi:MAG: S1 family peptidase [Solirubrobacterales bacterium]